MDSDNVLVVNNTVVQYIQKYKKGVAIDMRRKGLSYSAIQKATSVPKSTLSNWLKKIELSREQSTLLNRRRIDTARLNAKRRKLRTEEIIEKINKSSIGDIKNISRRELWLMGLILFWQHGQGKSSKLVQRSAGFSSSDPDLIKIFLSWLRDTGGILEDELRFDIFLKNLADSNATDRQRLRNESIAYWSKMTGFEKGRFNHIYVQKGPAKKRKGRETFRPNRHGFLRVRVKASSMLARQIHGWISGIRLYYSSGVNYRPS